MFPTGFPQKTSTENRFYYLPLQYLSHLYACEGICGIWCYEHLGCSQRAQKIQSNSQLPHKRTSLLPLMCKVFPLDYLMLAPTSVWCLRRQFKIQNRQKISPAKCWKTFMPLGSLNQATAGTDIYQWQHRDGRGRGTSPDCKAQPPPWWWLVTRSDKLYCQSNAYFVLLPARHSFFCTTAEPTLLHPWGKERVPTLCEPLIHLRFHTEQQHSTPAKNWYSSLSFYCLYFSIRTIILILWLKYYF